VVRMLLACESLHISARGPGRGLATHRASVNDNEIVNIFSREESRVCKSAMTFWKPSSGVARALLPLCGAVPMKANCRPAGRHSHSSRIFFDAPPRLSDFFGKLAARYTDWLVLCPRMAGRRLVLAFAGFAIGNSATAPLSPKFAAVHAILREQEPIRRCHSTRQTVSPADPRK